MPAEVEKKREHSEPSGFRRGVLLVLIMLLAALQAVAAVLALPWWQSREK